MAWAWGKPRAATRTPLRRWQERTGSSFPVLARLSGVSLRTVERIAAGKPASGKTAVALARHTSISVAELVKGTA